MHPDKNMGSPLASESFKKLQCAYEASLCTWKWIVCRFIELDTLNPMPTSVLPLVACFLFSASHNSD